MLMVLRGAALAVLRDDLRAKDTRERRAWRLAEKFNVYAVYGYQNRVIPGGPSILR